MIVKNEAARLGHCLASVQTLVDEMVVVDTGSTDDTVAIARSFGAKVSRFDWCEDFSAARNQSLKLCTGEWVLILDADERLDPAGIALIRTAISTARAQGYLLTLRNHLPSGAYTGTHRGARRDEQGYPEAENLAYITELPALRLIRNHGRIQYTGRIHELIEPAFESLGWKATPLPAVIHHLGKANPTQELAKQQAYFRLAAQDAKEHPGNKLALYNLMQEAAMVKNWETCAEAALAFLRLAPRGAPLKVRLDGALALRELGRYDEAEHLLLEANPNTEALPALLVAQGDLMAAQEKDEEAAEAFLRAIDLDPHFTSPFLSLSRLLQRHGDLASAQSLLEAGLDQNPQDLLLWQALVGLAASAGDIRAAARFSWEALAAFPHGGEGVWHGFVAISLLQTGGTAEASEVLARGLKAFPGNPELEAIKKSLNTST